MALLLAIIPPKIRRRDHPFRRPARGATRFCSSPTTPMKWGLRGYARRVGILNKDPRCSANILVCGFTELSSSVFPCRPFFHEVLASQ